MTPLFFPTAPWARRSLLLTGALCLGLLAAMVHEARQQQGLERQLAVARQEAAARQQALRQWRAQQQKQRRQPAFSAALTLLDAIGTALTPEVALLAVEVQSEKSAVRLKVKTTSLAALLAFSERLQQLPAQVALENHQQSPQEADWPIAAALSVRFPQKEGNDAAP